MNTRRRSLPRCTTTHRVEQENTRRKPGRAADKSLSPVCNDWSSSRALHNGEDPRSTSVCLSPPPPQCLHRRGSLCYQMFHCPSQTRLFRLYRKLQRESPMRLDPERESVQTGATAANGCFASDIVSCWGTNRTRGNRFDLPKEWHSTYDVGNATLRARLALSGGRAR